MSLPPHILRIKRKRDEEPVDSLYIESRQSDSKRRHTENDFVFRRLITDQNSAAFTSPQTGSVGLPEIVATKPGDEKLYDRGLPLQSSASNSGSVNSQSVIKTAGLLKATTTLPRRFQLSRDVVERTSPPPSNRKRRRSSHAKPNVAVFVATQNNAGKTEVTASSTTTETDALPTTVVSGGSRLAGSVAEEIARPLTPGSLRKRPGITSSPSKNKSASILRQHSSLSSLTASDATYQAMQRYANELDDGRNRLEKDKNGDATNNNKASVTEDISSAMDLATDMDDTMDDYVYDTYTRHAIQVNNDLAVDQSHTLAKVGEANVNAQDDLLRQDSNGRIGYLVIPEADQTLWETFYDSDAHSSDENDWDSEQDDENAENYYGADYPEDEVASDDELGFNAYGYRRGSDDEQYGSGDEAWSDEDMRNGSAAPVPPWTRYALQSGDKRHSQSSDEDI